MQNPFNSFRTLWQKYSSVTVIQKMKKYEIIWINDRNIVVAGNGKTTQVKKIIEKFKRNEKQKQQI